MSNRLILITGSTAGIGKVAAAELAKQGHQVIVHGRDPEKTERVAKEVGAAGFLLADLSSMQAVRDLAAQVKAKYGKLDVLLNNAGGMNVKREVTIDGFEKTFAVNHLAYFLLSNLLLPELAKSDAPRIVNVSSNAHTSADLNFDDMMMEKGWWNWIQYGRSKLCNILFTRELARRLVGKMTVNCLHPGFVASDFLSKGGFYKLIKPLAYAFAISEAEGAKTSIYLASSPAVATVTGKYFYRCKEKQPNAWARNDESARRLWELSEKLTGLENASPLPSRGEGQGEGAERPQ